jgi:hypothetical protein
MHVCEVRPRKDHRGVDLLSDALPFGRLWYGEPTAVANAIGYTKHSGRSHHAVIRVYDDAGNVIETPPIKLACMEPEPIETLNCPVVLLRSALVPVAVLSWPVVVASSACYPVPVLSKPSVFLARACEPTPVLKLLVVLNTSA